MSYYPPYQQGQQQPRNQWAPPSDSYAQSNYYGGQQGYQQPLPPPVPPRPNSNYGAPPQPSYPGGLPQQQSWHPGHSPQPSYTFTPPPPSQPMNQQYGAPYPPYPSHSPQPSYNGGYGGYGGVPSPMPSPAPAPVHSTAPPYPTNPGGLPSYPRPGQMPSYSTNQWVKAQTGPRPPPVQMQSFMAGNVKQTFQHSTCQGKRKALLIGINYYNTKKMLNGCINDVVNIKEFLMRAYKYQSQDMVILTDDQTNPLSIPTRANILKAMKWLVAGAEPNDSLFFHFSGHGGQTKDLDGDEADGYDETIYPVDYVQRGHIVDDEMHDLMVRPLKPGVRLTAIFDSCHSGTALDLPFVYSTAGTLKEQNLMKDAGMSLLGAFSSYRQKDFSGIMQSGMEFVNKASHGKGAEERAKKTKASPADVIQWSGSKDSQTSADDRGSGAMSRAFVAVMSKNPNQSYKSMLNSLRDELGAGKFTQKPQLSCSHPLDTDLLFIM